MSAITITGLALQFDSDTVTSGTPREQAIQMVGQINEVVSRDEASPFLINVYDLDDSCFVLEQDDDTDVCDKCMMVKPACQIGRTDENGNTICGDCEEELTK